MAIRGPPTPIPRAWYTASIAEFLQTPVAQVIGSLAANCDFTVLPAQRDAWLVQCDVLRRTLPGVQGSIVLEFSIPRMGRRIDVVLLVGPIILAIEFKVAAIARFAAGADNLRLTSHRIDDIVDRAMAERQKVICLVTGVPGSGKTLVGLNVATRHRREVEELTHAVFLSGNGPLVAVLREALTRDEVARKTRDGQKVRKGVVGESVKAFIQNAHHFRDASLSDEEPPIEHVVIFDEAQRAWNLKQTANFMKRKKKRPRFAQSEPEFLISVLDRHRDWAVIIQGMVIFVPRGDGPVPLWPGPGGHQPLWCEKIDGGAHVCIVEPRAFAELAAELGGMFPAVREPSQRARTRAAGGFKRCVERCLEHAVVRKSIPIARDRAEAGSSTIPTGATCLLSRSGTKSNHEATESTATGRRLINSRSAPIDRLDPARYSSMRWLPVIRGSWLWCGRSSSVTRLPLCGYLPRRRCWRARALRTARPVRRRRRTTSTRSNTIFMRVTPHSTSPPLPTD